jgi:alkanesulfonate monooxygenase SsuD/methylene tetrahydromethanopterin reductase-like flavin-dependent oxidoreductase (luciferase family)
MLMARLELGRVGIVVGRRGDGDTFAEAATLLEGLGYSTIWLAGPQIRTLRQVAWVMSATRTIQVATGIISVDRFDARAVAAAYKDIATRHPGRFILGLDLLDDAKTLVPASARVLAALGPRMLHLARERAAGAYPLLVTPAYTAEARRLLGPDPVLVIGQFVVVESDPATARTQAQRMLRDMTASGGAYAANVIRMGFKQEDLRRLSTRLVDGLCAWGDPSQILERVDAHLRAGADQVALCVLSEEDPGQLPVKRWEQLADALSALDDREVNRIGRPDRPGGVAGR